MSFNNVDISGKLTVTNNVDISGINNTLKLINDFSFADISNSIDACYNVLNLRQLREFISGYEFINAGSNNLVINDSLRSTITFEKNSKTIDLFNYTTNEIITSSSLTNTLKTNINIELEKSENLNNVSNDLIKGGRVNETQSTVYFNSNYFIVSALGQIFKSSNYKNWTKLDSTGITDYTSLTNYPDIQFSEFIYYGSGFHIFNNKLYILNVKNNTDLVGYESSDGESWTRITYRQTNGATSDNGIKSGLFIKINDSEAIIYNPNTYIHQLSESNYIKFENGAWIENQLNNLSLSINLRFTCIIYSTTFLCFYYTSNSSKIIYKSTEFFINLQQIDLTNLCSQVSEFGMHGIVELNNKIFVIGRRFWNEDPSFINISQIFYSNDGDNFYKSNGSNPSDVFDVVINKIVYNDILDIYLSVGTKYSRIYLNSENIIMISENGGITWTSLSDSALFSSFLDDSFQSPTYLEGISDINIQRSVDYLNFNFLIINQISDEFQMSNSTWDLRSSTYSLPLTSSLIINDLTLNANKIQYNGDVEFKVDETIQNIITTTTSLSNFSFNINNFLNSIYITEISNNWNSIVNGNHDYQFVASPVNGYIVFSSDGTSFSNANPNSFTYVNNQLQSNQALLYLDVSTTRYFFVNNDTSDSSKRGLYKSNCGDYWQKLSSSSFNLPSNIKPKTLLNARQSNGDNRIIVFSDSSYAWVSDNNGQSFEIVEISLPQFTSSANLNSEDRLNAVWMTEISCCFVAFENGDCYYNLSLDASAQNWANSWNLFEGGVGRNIRSIAHSPELKRTIIVGSYIFYSFYLDNHLTQPNVYDDFSNLEFIEYETLFYSDFYKIIWTSQIQKFLAIGHGYTPICFSNDGTDWDLYYQENGFDIDYPGLYSKKMFYLKYPFYNGKFRYNDFQNFQKYEESFSNETLTSSDLPSTQYSVYGISNHVKKFSDNLFENNTELQYINNCNKVREFGNSCLSGCVLLRYFKFFDNTVSIGDSMFENCNGMSVVALPYNNQITKVPDNFCKNCSTLSHIELKNNIIEIGESAFENAGNYTSSDFNNIPSFVKRRLYPIGNNEDLTNLTELYIPASVQTIRKNAFKNCRNLKYIYFHGNYPINIEENAFLNIAANYGNKFVLFHNGFSDISLDDFFSKCGIVGVSSDYMYDINISPNTDHEIWYNKSLSTDRNTVRNFNNFDFSNIEKVDLSSAYDSNFYYGNTNGYINSNIPKHSIICIKLRSGFIAESSNSLIEFGSGKYLTNKFTTGSSSNISIFLAHNAEKITTIYDEFLNQNESLSILTLNDSVKYFREYAFKTCRKLKFFKIPKFLKIITRQSFTESRFFYLDFPNSLVNINANSDLNNESYLQILPGYRASNTDTYTNFNLVNFNFSKSDRYDTLVQAPYIEFINIPSVYTSIIGNMTSYIRNNNQIALIYFNLNNSREVLFEYSSLMNLIHIINLPILMQLRDPDTNFNGSFYIIYMNYTNSITKKSSNLSFLTNFYNNENFYSDYTNVYKSQLLDICNNIFPEYFFNFTIYSNFEHVITSSDYSYNQQLDNTSFSLSADSSFISTRIIDISNQNKSFIRVQNYLEYAINVNSSSQTYKWYGGNYKSKPNLGYDISKNNNTFGHTNLLNNTGYRIFINDVSNIYLYSYNYQFTTNEDEIKNWDLSDTISISSENLNNISNFIISKSGDKIIYEDNNKIIVRPVDISNSQFSTATTSHLYTSYFNNNYIYGRAFSITDDGNYIAIGNYNSSGASFVDVWNLHENDIIYTVAESSNNEFGFDNYQHPNNNIFLHKNNNNLTLIIGCPSYNILHTSSPSGRVKIYEGTTSKSSFSETIVYDASNLMLNTSFTSQYLSTTSYGFGFSVTMSISDNGDKFCAVGMPFTNNNNNQGLVITFVILEDSLKILPINNANNNSNYEFITFEDYTSNKESFIGKSLKLLNNYLVIPAARFKNTDGRFALYIYKFKELNIETQILNIPENDIIYNNNFNIVEYNDLSNTFLFGTNYSESSLNLIYNIINYGSTEVVTSTFYSTNTKQSMTIGLTITNNVDTYLNEKLYIQNENKLLINNISLPSYLDNKNYIVSSTNNSVDLGTLNVFNNITLDNSNVFSLTSSDYINNLQVNFDYVNIDSYSYTLPINNNKIVYGNEYFINVFFDNSSVNCINSFRSLDNGVNWNLIDISNINSRSYNDVSNSIINLTFDSSDNKFYLTFSNIFGDNLYELEPPLYDEWKVSTHLDSVTVEYHFGHVKYTESIQLIYSTNISNLNFTLFNYAEEQTISIPELHSSVIIEVVYLSNISTYLKAIFNSASDFSKNTLYWITSDELTSGISWYKVETSQILQNDMISTFNTNVSRNLFKSIAYNSNDDRIVIAGDKSLFYSYKTTGCANTIDIIQFIDVSFEYTFNGINYKSSEINFNEVIYTNSSNTNHFILIGDNCPIFYSLNGIDWVTDNNIINSDILSIIDSSNSSIAFSSTSNIINLVQTEISNNNLIKTNKNKIFGNESLDFRSDKISVKEINVNKINASELDFTNLGSVNPHIPGRLYKDSNGFLRISSG